MPFCFRKNLGAARLYPSLVQSLLYLIKCLHVSINFFKKIIIEYIPQYFISLVKLLLKKQNNKKKDV